MILPNHLAIIMDGNGRWAQERELPRTKGHEKGAEIVTEIVTYCRKIGIKNLTLYAFSEENWKRPLTEVNKLMELLLKFTKSKKKLLLDNNIHFNPIGDIDKLPALVKRAVLNLKKITKSNPKMTLNIAISYSSRNDILRITNFFRDNPDCEINEENFSKNLYTGASGDVDLLIRTGGEKRISNFLLWELSYSELFFEQSFWPDFNKEKLNNILKDFSKRNRRYGSII